MKFGKTGKKSNIPEESPQLQKKEKRTERNEGKGTLKVGKLRNWKEQLCFMESTRPLSRDPVSKTRTKELDSSSSRVPIAFDEALSEPSYIINQYWT